MPKSMGIRKKIIEGFEKNKNKKFSMNEIYKMPPSHLKNNTRYKDTVRSTVYKLVERGIIKKQSYNCYYYSEKK